MPAVQPASRVNAPRIRIFFIIKPFEYEVSKKKRTTRNIKKTLFN
ncbi:hypothetical protein DR96_4016 (plasmid) [Providencia stuartii]|nr:hypothetical protein DR96_4016 [Providencia stuartii]